MRNLVLFIASVVFTMIMAGGCQHGQGIVFHDLPGQQTDDPADPTWRLEKVKWGEPVGDLQAGIAPEVDLAEAGWYDPDARPLAGLYLRNVSWKHSILIPHPNQLTGWDAWARAPGAWPAAARAGAPAWKLAMLDADGREVPDWRPMQSGDDPVEVIRLAPRQTIVLSASLDPAEWGAPGARSARFVFSYQNRNARGIVRRGPHFDARGDLSEQYVDRFGTEETKAVGGVWQGAVSSGSLEVRYRRSATRPALSPVSPLASPASPGSTVAPASPVPPGSSPPADRATSATRPAAAAPGARPPVALAGD